jgi:hypothetical protein
VIFCVSWKCFSLSFLIVLISFANSATFACTKLFVKIFISFFLLLLFSVNLSTPILDENQGVAAIEMNEAGENTDETAKEGSEKEKEEKSFKHIRTFYDEGSSVFYKSIRFFHLAFFISELHRTMLEVPPEA